MNPTEINEALEAISKVPFDPDDFGFAFATANDNPRATVSRLRSGTTNKSDVPGGVLLNRKLHYAPAGAGEVDRVLDALRGSRKAERARPSERRMAGGGER